MTIPINPFGNPTPRLTPEQVAMALLKSGYTLPQVVDVLTRLRDK